MLQIHYRRKEGKHEAATFFPTPKLMNISLWDIRKHFVKTLGYYRTFTSILLIFWPLGVAFSKAILILPSLSLQKLFPEFEAFLKCNF